MPHEGRSHAALEKLIREFAERRRTDPGLSIARFASEHPEAGAELPSRLAELEGAGATFLQAGDAESAPETGGERTEPLGAGDTVALRAALAGREPRGDERRTIDRRYEVVRVLGEGGFGKVFLVRDLLYPGEWRALKTILPAHSAKPAFETRFRTEIRVLRALAHPGIPQIHNDGKTEEGEFYYTMAFVEGPTLAEVLKKEGALPPERVVRLVRQMLAILEYAHAKGVVHRDLKPANVMLVAAGTPAEELKILDFGIAKVLRAEGDLEGAPETLHTMAGMGTPQYMSPEQIRGKDVDPRSDIYALGIMIYQMCSGRLPFSGKTDLEVATARLEHAPTPLTAEHAPEWLRAAVMQLLERDREKRPTTREIHARFDKLAGGQRALTRSLRFVAAGVLVVAFALAWILWGGGEHGGPGLASVRGGSEPAPAPAPLAALVVDEPRDGAQLASGRFELRGRSPGASEVVIDGARVAVDPDGTFRHTLELRENAASTVTVANADGTGPQTFGVVVDTVKPAIVCEPLPRLVATRALVLTGTVRDDAPGSLAREGARLDDEPLALGPDGSFSRTLALGADGEHAFRLVALDQAGNVASWQGVVTLDTLAPTVAWDEPPPARTAEPRATLRGQVADLHPATLRVACGGEEREIALTQGRFAYELDLAFGRNDVTLVAVDAAGNASTPLTATIQRDRPPVRVLATNPASGATFPPEQESVLLSGSADRALAWVLVNDVRAELDGETGFRLELPLADGSNRFDIVPYDADDMAGEKVALTLERVPLRLPTGCAPSAGAGADPSGRARRVVHERTGIALVLVTGGATSFYIGEKEVTRAEYQRVAGGSAPASSVAALPVVEVPFDDAQRFCELAGLRLPTTEEWDLAGRGPEDFQYPWGNEWLEASCHVASSEAAPVGSYAEDRSWCGALDMAGNVSEWCTENGARALRGGSWSSDAESCKLSRPRNAPKGGSTYVGFRVCLDAP